jgi:hypothetical protein
MGSSRLPEAAEPSGHQRGATERGDTAKVVLPAPAPNLLASTSVRIDIPREAGLEHEDVDEKPTITERRNPDSEAHLSPSRLEYCGPFSTSFASLESRISRANSASHIGDRHEQGPANTEISVATYELPHSSENTHSLQPATKISQKEKVIAFAKVALQVAAAGLKAAPIPNLDQIPKVLLSLIQTYEVSHLAGSLLNSTERRIQMFRLWMGTTKNFKICAN